jgi:hypothetical protein
MIGFKKQWDDYFKTSIKHSRIRGNYKRMKHTCQGKNDIQEHNK